MTMRIDGMQLTMPTLTMPPLPATAPANAAAADGPSGSFESTPVGAPSTSQRRGIDQAVQGVTMLQDPDLGFWPSFLSGKRYQDLDLPLNGKTEPGRLDTGIWVPHVRQGALGDCWFMGTLASLALAKDPKWHPAIRRIDEDNVALKFGDREVGVSDQLPVKRDGKLLFARQNTPHFTATWPVYYEKAAAAIRGSYGALDGGWPSEAFEMLLGTAPKDVATPADILGYIGTAFDAGLPVAVTTRPDQTELMDSVKLHSNHTYAVRKMVTITRDGTPEVGVKLWNPWGGEHPIALTQQQFEALADSVTTPEESFGWSNRRGIVPT